jgi:hypothetical protein
VVAIEPAGTSEKSGQVLCNRYGLPLVEFKMGRRQGAAKAHIHCDLQLSRNAGAGAIFNSTLRAAVL